MIASASWDRNARKINMHRISDIPRKTKEDTVKRRGTVKRKEAEAIGIGFARVKRDAIKKVKGRPSLTSKLKNCD
jgi:hypothetical protein